ncbi:hypothetical protein LTR04_006893 [Oleoguttula sp. CCFEE 6159]|nr:hypothetical protein LTR04_006893 [Oleoguttula sp. CCFEE 6159]
MSHPQGSSSGPTSASALHAGPPSGSGVNPNAAPGPIPATTPLVVRQDGNGVQWIAFEYSRDRVKMEYTIRCDVESVNVDELPQDFKNENCVYPRACCNKDQYKGNRLHYETECNTVGWALAQLNPCLRGKRGLIQRAVDSWRNSNQDPRLRSRRVRRMAKISNRKAIQAAQHPNHMSGPNGPTSATAPAASGVSVGNGSRQLTLGGQPLHHHHAHPDGSSSGGNGDISGNNEYNDGSHHHHHQTPNAPANTSPRHTQNFYPTYPNQPSLGSSTMPTMQDGMDMKAPTTISTATAAAPAAKVDEEERKVALFGNPLPEPKRRKFILVEDVQRGTRVRVRVMLDQINMDDVHDGYRKHNSVFPRSYFPVQMQSPPASPRGSRFFEDDEPEQSGAGTGPTTGKTFVPVPVMDGSEAKVPLPRMSRTRRNKEVTLNELGYRMSWSQGRVFSGRTLFLQRSLDAYRNKMRSQMVAAGQSVSTIAPHFETRVGKRKWLERAESPKRESSPQVC